jgi:tetratricopeptide (TPR) repeat protein
LQPRVFCFLEPFSFGGTVSAFLQSLSRSLRRIVSKQASQLIGLWGEPGIGKTFTANAILNELSCPHLRLHAGMSTLDLLRALPRAKKLPVWAEVQLERMARGEVTDTHVFAEAVAASLMALAPFVVYLEDVHDASPGRLKMIRAIAGAVARSRGVALLVTSRAELPEPFINHRLEPLDQAQTRVLLEAQLGASLPDEALEWIGSRTHGNPLFALEFLRYLSRQGLLWSDGQQWHWRAPKDDFVPVTVEALIEEFTAGVLTSPSLRAALEARTMLPAELEVAHLRDLWAKVADLEPEVLEQLRADLERGGLLRSTDVAHPLFGEVVRAGLSLARRQSLSRRVYEGLSGQHPILAVRFLSDAGLEPEEALSVIERAITDARNTGQSVQANRLLALSVAWRNGTDKARAALEAARGLYETSFHDVHALIEIVLEVEPDNVDAIYLLVEWELVARNKDAALEALNRLPESERSSLRWWERQIKFAFLGEDWAEAKRLWFEHPGFHASAPAMAIHDVAFAHHYTSDQLGALALAEKGLKRTNLKPLERCDLWNIQGCALGVLDRHEEAIAAYSRAIDLAAPLGVHVWVSTYHGNRAESFDRLARLGEAIADAERCVQLRLHHGSPAQVASSQPFLGVLLVHHGEYERAEAILLETEALHERLAANRFQVVNRLALCELYLAWEPPHGAMLARRYAASALALARGRSETDLLIESLEACINVELRGKKPQNAKPLLKEFTALVEGHQAQSWSARHSFLQGQYSLMAQPEQARIHLERAVKLAESSGIIWQAQAFAVELNRLNNNLEMAQSRLEWFEARGLHWLADRVRKRFPELEIGISPSEPIVSVRLLILGPVQLELDGQALPTRARKRLEILVYLLEARIAGHAEVTLAELLETFYPHQMLEESRNTLRQQMYLIRSSLGNESILSTQDGYALGNVSSDAEEFLLTGNAELWRGPYLERLGDGWHPGVRDALVLALRSRVQELLETDTRNAARLAQMLLELEAFDPEILRLCLLALSRNNETALAKKLFEDHRDRMLPNRVIAGSLEDFVFSSPQALIDP